MFNKGDKIKVPILVIRDSRAEKDFAYGEVLGESKTVEDATELKVELQGGRYTIANIKNSELVELNS